jgi:hypothetical protein
MVDRYEVAPDDGRPFRIDEVTAVLVPADPYSRTVVSSGVTASLWDRVRDRALPDRLIRNLSGHLVLRNQPLDTVYSFRVDPRGAGYQGPFDVDFRPQDGARRKVLWLQARPDKAFDPDTTLVRGVIIREGDLARPAVATQLIAEPAQDDPVSFEATTDERGAFAIAVRLEPVVLGDDLQPVSTKLTMTDPQTGAGRDLDIDLDRSREHIFTMPLDLDGTNTPPFAHGMDA